MLVLLELLLIPELNETIMRQRKQIIVGWVTENFIPSARADDYGVQKMMESLNNVLTFHKEKSTVQSNAPIHVKRIPIRAMFFSA